MRKRMFLFIFLVVSLFVFSSRVEADSNKTTMWLKCDTTSRQEENDGDWIFFRSDTGWKAHKAGETDVSKVYDIIDCWFNDEDDIDKLNRSNATNKCKKKEYGETIDKKLSSGNCPKYIKTKSNLLRIAESGTVLDSAVLETGKNEYLVYSLNDISYNPENRNNFFVLEFYDSVGEYHIIRIEKKDGKAMVYNATLSVATIHNDVLSEIAPSDYSTRLYSEIVHGKNFFRIGHGFSYSHLSNLDLSLNNSHSLLDDFVCNSYESCKNLINTSENKKYGVYESFEIEFDSGNNFSKLEVLMDNWIKDNKDMLEKENLLVSETDATLINTCKSFVQKSETEEFYQFPSNYSAQKMLNGLNEFVTKMNVEGNITNNYKLCSNNETGNATNSASNCIIYNAFGGYLPDNFFNIKNSANDAEKQFEKFYALFKNDIEKMLNDRFSNSGTGEVYKVNEQVQMLGKCFVYLDKYSSDYGVDKKDLDEIRPFFENLLREYEIEIIIDCKGLLGEDLINKINKYLDIVKIAIPLILIAFGVIDFSKAFFGGSDDEMRKSQKTFFKRVGIAILIYFVPVFVKLLLTIANEAWSFFSPDTCGLF